MVLTKAGSGMVHSCARCVFSKEGKLARQSANDTCTVLFRRIHIMMSQMKGDEEKNYVPFAVLFFYFIAPLLH
jgi:hypothetical protein